MENSQSKSRHIRAAKKDSQSQEKREEIKTRRKRRKQKEKKQKERIQLKSFKEKAEEKKKECVKNNLLKQHQPSRNLQGNSQLIEKLVLTQRSSSRVCKN